MCRVVAFLDAIMMRQVSGFNFDCCMSALFMLNVVMRGPDRRPSSPKLLRKTCNNAVKKRWYSDTSSTQFHFPPNPIDQLIDERLKFIELLRFLPSSPGFLDPFI